MPFIPGAFSFEPYMFASWKKKRAALILSVFETGKPLGDPSAVAVLKDDAGISYGIHQATHKSGSLHKVVSRYVQASTSNTVGFLKNYLAQLRKPETRHELAKDKSFKALLKLAGDDPEMVAAQEWVFEEFYMKPAIEACEGSDFTTALGLAVVYDSHIQGSWAKIRDRVRISRGNDSALDFEKAWISRYVLSRDGWLEGSKNRTIANSDYRTDFFLEQIRRGNWDLDGPMTVAYNNGKKTVIKASDVPPKGDETSRVNTATPDTPSDNEISSKPDPASESTVLTPANPPSKPADPAVGGPTSGAPVVEATIPAVPPLPTEVPGPLKRFFQWAGGLSIGSYLASLAVFKDHPELLGPVLALVKLAVIGLAGVGVVATAMFFIERIQKARYANQLNQTRLATFADKNAANVDFKGWKSPMEYAQPEAKSKGLFGWL